MKDSTGLSFLKYAVKYLALKSCRYLAQASPSQPLEPLPERYVNMAVCITGGLGDAIIQARLIRDIAARCPRTHFYLFLPVPGQGDWIFRNQNGVKAVLPLELFDYYREYLCDCALVLNTFAVFNEEHFNAEKIRGMEPELLKLFASTHKKRGPWDIYIDNHPVMDGAFARQATALGFNRYDFQAEMLGIPIPEPALNLPLDFVKAEEIQKEHPRYVTVNTGFDQNFIISTRTATKCYPVTAWSELVRLIKAEFPSLAVIQVGGGNSPAVPGTDRNLAGKTSLAESAAILKGSLLHIDIEGGLVHVCASLGIRCAVLFGPTDRRYFGYPQNINLRDEECSECWWASESWMEYCPKKKMEPECMKRLTPERVLTAIRPELNALMKRTASGGNFAYSVTSGSPPDRDKDMI